MRKNKLVEIKVNVLESVICNKCGYDVAIIDKDQSFDVLNQFHSVIIDCGYGSKYDATRFSFDLCDNCLSEYLGLFKVKVEEEYSY